MTGSSFRFASISALRKSLDMRAVSADELARESLQLLDGVGRGYNAVATLLPERALREAAAADRRLARGHAPVLCGIPYGAKDLLAAAGGPTTWGAPPFRDQVFDFDATAVARLRRQGAALMAKLSLVELVGASRPTQPGASLHGSGRNPWDLSRYSGGSSAGSAAAVAGGLLPFALGSETGGSIGGPAAFCGITGVRPTLGLVSRFGALVISPTLDKFGPLARSAEDCALVLEAIAGPDPRDPAVSGRRFKSLSPKSVPPVRVGFAEEDEAQLAPHARAAIVAGMDEFRRLEAAASARAVLPPEIPYERALGTIMAAEPAAIFARHIESGELDTLVDVDGRQHLRDALRITAREYLEALQARELARRAFDTVFSEVDVLLSFSRPSTAPLLDLPSDRRARLADDAPAGNAYLKAAANLTGLPGVYFPCGLAEDGLPVGLHLVGPAFSEPLLLALVASYQRQTGHHLLRPPV